MATIIRANGKREYLTGTGPNKTLTLEQMQEVVGGFIELVLSPAARQYFMVVNEEGKLTGLPINYGATALARDEGVNDVIVGDAILISTGEVE